MSTIGKSKTVSFGVTSEQATVVVVVFGMREKPELAQFAYPAREGYTTLHKVGNRYSGMLPETATAEAPSGDLLMEVKIWNEAGANEIKRFRIAATEDVYTQKTTKNGD